MAVVIPTTGYLLERLTTRQIFFASAGFFLAGTVVAALAPSFVALLLGRVLQAGGTALMIPTLMTVAMTLVPPQ
ncbi:MFS transporter, partial [Escherichia coli]|nr:MFS transporter [Escherichia coli]